MKKKKNLIIILSVVAIGVVALIIAKQGSKDATFEQDFHVEDIDAITKIYIADKTLKQTGKLMPLSFREKIELARLIDLLMVDAIELPSIENQKVDALLIKSVAAAVKNAEIAVPVKLSSESVESTWNALRDAARARLQVAVPVSSVQMEYLFLDDQPHCYRI